MRSELLFVVHSKNEETENEESFQPQKVELSRTSKKGPTKTGYSNAEKASVENQTDANQRRSCKQWKRFRPSAERLKD